MNDAKHSTLEAAIASALNHACAENESNTPDHILAEYLLNCLEAWSRASQQREAWYGVAHGPTAASLLPPAIILDAAKVKP